MEHHSPLLRKFITLGRVTAEQLKLKQAEAQSTAELICLCSGMTGQELAEQCLDLFRVPMFDLSDFDVEQLPKELIKEKLIRQHHLLPLVKKAESYLSPPLIPLIMVRLRTSNLAQACNVKSLSLITNN